MARVDVRVNMPDHNTEETLDLGYLVNGKHVQDGETSILKTLPNLDMDKFLTDLDSAKSLHAEAEALHREAQEKMQQADKLLGYEQGMTSRTEGTIYNALARIRDFLLAVFKGSEESLGAWGFDVVLGGSTPEEPEEPEEPEV